MVLSLYYPHMYSDPHSATRQAGSEELKVRTKHRFRNSRVQEVHTQFQNIAWFSELNHCCSKCRRTNFFYSGYELSVLSLFYLPSILYVISVLSVFISSFAFLSSIYFLSSILFFFKTHVFFSILSLLFSFPFLFHIPFFYLLCTVIKGRLKASPKTHFAWGGACTYTVCVCS